MKQTAVGFGTFVLGGMTGAGEQSWAGAWQRLCGFGLQVGCVWDVTGKALVRAAPACCDGEEIPPLGGFLQKQHQPWLHLHQDQQRLQCWEDRGA